MYFLHLSFIGIIFLAGLGSSIANDHLRVLNQKHHFKRWPGNRIFFYLDNAYSVQEAQFIKLAISRVMSDLQNCVTFVEVLPSAGQFKVKITPLKSDSAAIATYCHSYPGLYERAQFNGHREQVVTIAGGPHGCLDGTLHRTMKYIAILLGKRNEHQRPDRDQFIELMSGNIIQEMQEDGYRRYAPDEARQSCPYDYCSVTHNLPTDYAQQDKAFTVKNPPYFIPTLGRLSECDCRELKMLYGCPADSCAPLDCAAQIPTPNELRDTTPSNNIGLAQNLPFATQSSNPAVATSVLTTLDSTSICYAVPVNAQQPTSFSVVTAVTPATAMADGAIEEPMSSCSISAAPWAERRTTAGSQRKLVRKTRVVDTNPEYARWPGNRVPYYIDPKYSQAEQQIVRKAIATITASMKSCIQFVPVRKTSTQFKVKITPLAADGVTQETQCSSYPGLYSRFKRTRKEQPLVLARGSNGCLGGTHHNILKYFAILLGKRNEHQRPDRDAHIEVLPANIMTGMDFAYEKYNWTHAKAFYPYDYCSVTHNQPSVFAKPGTQAFNVKDAPYRIPVLDRLSEVDCRELSEVYSCDPARCEPLNCKLQLASTTAGTTTLRSTTSTSTTSTSTASTSIMTTKATSPSTTATSSRSSSTPRVTQMARTTRRPRRTSIPSTTTSSTQSTIKSTLATSIGTTSAVTSSQRMSSSASTKLSTITTTSGALGTSAAGAVQTSSTTAASTRQVSSTTSLAPNAMTSSIVSTVPPTPAQSLQALTQTAGGSFPCASTTGSALLLPVTVSSVSGSGVQVCYRLPPITVPTTFTANLTVFWSNLGYVGFTRARSTC